MHHLLTAGFRSNECLVLRHASIKYAQKYSNVIFSEMLKSLCATVALNGDAKCNAHVYRADSSDVYDIVL